MKATYRHRNKVCVLSAAAFLAGGALALSSNGAFADEGGVSFWLPGLFGSLAAVPQQPGWALTVTNYYTNVSAAGNIAAAREVTVGRFNPTVNVNLNVNLKANADLALINPSYVFATPVLGGQLLPMASIGTSTGELRNFYRNNSLSAPSDISMISSAPIEDRLQFSDQ
jgi:hypothetical protein